MQRLSQVCSQSLPFPASASDPKAQVEKPGTALSAEALKGFLLGPYAYLREQIFELIKKDKTFAHYHLNEMTKEEERHAAARQALLLAKLYGPNLDQMINEPLYLLEFIAAVTQFNQALATKLSVHYILYVKTIMSLGTLKHQPFIKKALSLEDYGSFAMTELGHGSNVSAIETTATYDHPTRSFILNTPKETAMKFWIGAASEVATITVLVAQLIIDGKKKGVHIFVVPLRSKKDRTLYPGIMIGDCGSKTGVAF